MHLRPFSYPVTKPYPFRWFTPLVIIGGLVLVVLFFLWTYPPNAYEMQSQTSFHPRETEKYKPPPPRLSWWYGDDLKAKCQPYELLVGSRFFTVNRGFLYTVDRVYRYDPQANINITVEESVSYLGDTLENCRPIKIIIGLGKDDSAEPPTFWISWIGESYFDLRATCAINTANGQRMWIEISTKKSGVAKDEFDYIIDHHRTQSFWWGAQLLNTYWFSLMQVLAQKGHFKDKNNGFYNRGRFTFNYNYDSNNIKSIRDANFHDLGFYLVSSSRPHVVDDRYWRKNFNDASFTKIYNNPEHDMSSAITEASYFAKIAHSFLLADLGNPKLPNMLLEEEELRYFLSGQSRNINRLPNGTLSVIPSPKEDFAFLYMLPPPNSTLDQDLVPLNKSWDAFKDRFHKDSKLETKTATIYKQYSCSVPRRKSWGRIFVLVLVADLVLLQAAWRLLTLVAGILVERQAPATAMTCSGCLGGNEDGRQEQIEMQSLISEDEGGQSQQR
ncbi:hypothetical protein MCOR22_006074 [Pyricularia oryzae]|nr:hypothetical protein MCOR22_006074 [Pyricularia oryzae]